MVEVPPYHSKTVGSAVQVQFYVCNGKRKRSQSQRFTYLSGEMRGFHLKGILDYTFMLLFFVFFLLTATMFRLLWEQNQSDKEAPFS